MCVFYLLSKIEKLFRSVHCLPHMKIPIILQAFFQHWLSTFLFPSFFSDPNKNFESNNKIHYTIRNWSLKRKCAHRCSIHINVVHYHMKPTAHNPLFNRPEIDFQMGIGGINRTETERLFFSSRNSFPQLPSSLYK